MKWWHKAASHFVEIPVEQTSSEHHKLLQVSVIRGRYQLATEHSIYSFDDLYLNFFKAFSQLSLPETGTVLVLGLGLGSIPWMLERHFAKQYSYVAVDIDEEVIRLASKYRLSSMSSPLEVIVADAQSFLRQNERQFDLVCVDVFVDDHVPDSITDRESMAWMKESLNEGGLLLWNRLYRSGHDKRETKRFYEERFKKEFPEGSYLDVDGNWILFERS